MGARHSQPGTSQNLKERESLRRSRARYLSQRLCKSDANLHKIHQVQGDQNGVGAENDVDNSVDDADVETDIVIFISAEPEVEMRRKDGDDTNLSAKRVVSRAGHYERTLSHYDETDHRAASVLPGDYEFPFENLVLEGGGNKGLAYCGAVRYLEELGVMQNVKRLAGTSAGGMFATLLAVGYNSYEVEEFLGDRIDRVFLDASCGYCSLLPNLLSSFGWNPGLKIFEWLGDKLKDKTGNADITFRQLYQQMGKCVCIVVTNLSQMATEYCHPKTTPEMPIRVAVRMSMAIPGMFSAMKYEHHGRTDVYVDGGMLCNYPIHCYDGWYLSMAPEDSFIRKLQPLKDIPIIMERNNRFRTFNHKTLGMLLYADGEEDILRYNLERRVGCLAPKKPKHPTKLYQRRQKEAKVKQRAEKEHARVVHAVDAFLRVLKKHNIDRNDIISREELEQAFKDESEFTREQAKVLFGDDYTVQKAFELLDRDQNGQIRYDELVDFIEENGVSLQTRFLGYERKEIKNFVSFLDMLQSTLVFNVKKLYVEERDLDRTVGINTGHVSTADFWLEEADREFIVERGYNSMKAFLQYYVVKNSDEVKRKPTPGQNSLTPPSSPGTPPSSPGTAPSSPGTPPSSPGTPPSSPSNPLGAVHVTVHASSQTSIHDGPESKGRPLTKSRTVR